MGRQAMTDDAALTTLLRAIRDSFHAFDRYAIAFACGDAAARIEALVGERDELLRGAEAWKPMVRALEARADALAKELAGAREGE